MAIKPKSTVKEPLVIPESDNTPPELKEMRSKRDSYRANLQYAIKQEETYKEKLDAGDEMQELKMLDNN